MRFDNVKLTQDILRRFQAGEDIPGAAFRTISPQGTEFRGVLVGWNDSFAEPWRWLLGRNSMEDPYGVVANMDND